MPAQWMVIASFGGGLDLSKNPAAIRDDQWTWAQNMRTENGTALSAQRYYPALSPPPYPAPLTGKEIIGILPNPFSLAAALLIVAEDPTAYPRQVHLYTATVPTATGEAWTVLEMVWDGVGSPVTHHQTHTSVQSAFLDQWLWITVGAGPDGYSMLRWGGGATYSTVIPNPPTASTPTFFRAAYLESFAGHLIAASVGTTETHRRTYRISDAGAGGGMIWKPDFDNSADEIVLDDSTSGITGLCLLTGNALAVFTRAGAYGVAPTGQDPPFTRSWIGARGTRDNSNGPTYLNPGPWLGLTPYGPAVVSFDNIYLPLDTAIGTPILRAFEGVAEGGPSQCARLLWHPRWATLYVPQLMVNNPAEPLFQKHHIFTYEPGAQAWGVLDVPLSGGFRNALDHAIVLAGKVTGTTLFPPALHRHVILHRNGSIWTERFMDDPTDTTTVSFVDTRDIAMPVSQEVAMVKVEWECLSATPMTLDVTAAVREQLDPRAQSGPVPDRSWGFDLTPLFDAAPASARCTLAAGEADAPLRAHGKWLRLRFSSTCPFRIRSVAIQLIDRAQRHTSPNPDAATTAMGPTRPAEWDRADYEIGEWGPSRGPLGGGESGGEW